MDLKAFTKIIAILIFTICCIFQPLHAQNKMGEAVFSPAAWSKDLDSIKKKITTEAWTSISLKETIGAVIALQKQANECTNNTKKELEKINTALMGSNTGKLDSQAESPRIDETKSNLDKRRSELNQLYAECQLVLLRAQDIFSDLQAREQLLITAQLFSKAPSVIENLTQLPTIQSVENQFNLNIFNQKLGVTYLTSSNLGMLIILIVLSIMAGYGTRRWCRNREGISDQSLLGFNITAVVFQYAYALFITLALAIFFTFYTLPAILSTYLATISIALFIYTALVAIIKSLFYPPPPAQPLIIFPGKIPRFFSRRLFYLLTLLLAYYVVTTLFQDQELLVPIRQLTDSLFITLLSISLISIIFVTTRIPKLFYEWEHVRKTLNIVFSITLLVILIAEWSGYHLFALYLVQNIAASIAIVLAAWLLHIPIKKGIRALKKQETFRYYLGVRRHKEILELTLCYIAAMMIIWGGVIVLLLKTWIPSTAYFNQIMRAVMDGFTFAGLRIIPSQVLLALVVFTLLALANRWLQSYVSRHSRSYVEEGAQVAIATIMGYSGFVIILIIALVVAGVNFTGLAIIAGALSVGIGFGLQNIVNDFISGLILLIEEPIRPGDRIYVDNIEGFVRRVRLRSTQIVTLDNSDVFVPNSKITSTNLTNYMFRNTKWRVICTIGIAYGCDLELAKKTLLEVATAHKEVIQEGPDAPKVLFRKFNDSSLQFDLLCIINDVNNKYRIESELNFAIAEAFKKKRIDIPFPQQDIHIKELPEEVTLAKRDSPEE
ncbi:mechanosensitive ion channel family protein [Aquicella lusitana]|uniref:Small-conductance mechanosensitive channel n=1 Tax=Aquicella lusitana TaxID=254246 RepID=A0A370GEF4_9COXI|nr:mechanosensitive ion channel domain-containing protein [Aquicella lusitana]RDI42067.1 small-conductance mechanosensitive channel [Aquicella lusitana]VVC74426.1 Mechanosensitive channel MscK [Aquicella lusitana]